MTNKNTTKNENLKIHLEYRDLRAYIEGSFETVWKSINEFLMKVAQTFTPKKAVVSTKGKDTPEIILTLRNRGFLNQKRLVREVYKKLKELGKTDITIDAIRMALKSLVEKGELKRSKKGNKFEYYAPYIE